MCRTSVRRTGPGPGALDRDVHRTATLLPLSSQRWSTATVTVRSQLACTDGGRGAFAHRDIRLRTNLNLNGTTSRTCHCVHNCPGQWHRASESGCHASGDADAAAIMAGLSAAPCQHASRRRPPPRARGLAQFGVGTCALLGVHGQHKVRFSILNVPRAQSPVIRACDGHCRRSPRRA